MQHHRRLALVAGAMLATAGAAPAAQAATVTCGQTITTSIRVDNNLTNCPGDGLVVGASNITIDLNYKTIDGVGNDSGIRNSAGHTGVTVRRGTVKQFSTGVGSSFGSMTLSNVVTTENSNHGVHTFLSEIVLNSVKARGNGLDGAAVFGGVPTVTSSEFNDNGDLGVRLHGVNSGKVYASDMDRNHLGLLLVDTTGVAVDFSDARDNVTSGFALFDGDGNRLTRLDAWGNGNWGIFGDQVSDGNTIRDNDTFSNGEDGIELEGINNLIQDNDANDNALLGIRAAPGNTDGGGNEASGNGDPAQCTGVSCS